MQKVSCDASVPENHFHEWASTFAGPQAAVLGFVGSPWTLATYLIEGGSTPLYKKIKTMTHVGLQHLHAL